MEKNGCRPTTLPPSENFDWKKLCFLCAEPIEKVLPKNPLKLLKYYHVRKSSLRDILLRACKTRTDAWSMAVQGRLESCSNLVAQGAAYHGRCHGRLMQPSVHDTRKSLPCSKNQDRSDAFDDMCAQLEAGDVNRIYRLQDISDILRSCTKPGAETYSMYHLQRKLTERYGDRVLISAGIVGRPVVVCLRGLADQVLTEESNHHADHEAKYKDASLRIVSPTPTVGMVQQKDNVHNESDYNVTVAAKRAKVSSCEASVASSESCVEFLCNTEMARPKLAAVLKAKQAWPQVMDKESDIENHHIFSDHFTKGDNSVAENSSADLATSASIQQQLRIDSADVTGSELTDIEVDSIDIRSIAAFDGAALAEDREGDDPEWSLSKKAIASKVNIGECIIHCKSVSSTDLALRSPRSIRSWHELLKIATIRNYRQILDIAVKIKTKADLPKIKYHNRCRGVFMLSGAKEVKHEEPKDGNALHSHPRNEQDSSSQEIEYIEYDTQEAENIEDDADLLLPPLNTDYDLSPYPSTHPANKHLEYMTAVLLQYRLEHFLCDALVMVDDGELQAHSVILSAASPVFKAAFTMPNVSHCVRISDVSIEVMKLVLDAIYTGRIECEDSKRFTVKEVLVDLKVDIGRLEECGIQKVVLDEIISKKKNDAMIKTNNRSVCFNSIEELNSYAADFADTAIDASEAEDTIHDDIGLDAVEDSEQCAMDTNLISCKSNDPCSSNRCCELSDQCNSLTSEHTRPLIRHLQDTYNSLCYRKQLLMLASLIEVVVKPTAACLRKLKYKQIPEKNMFTVKYWVPLYECGPRIAVCRTAFCRLFSIDSRKIDMIVNRIFTRKDFKVAKGDKIAEDDKTSKGDKITKGDKAAKGNGQKAKRRSNVSSAIAENSDVEDSTDFNDTDNESSSKASDHDSILALAAILCSDCQCRQCKGEYQCDSCGHKEWTQESLIKHTQKWCKNAPPQYNAEQSVGVSSEIIQLLANRSFQPDSIQDELQPLGEVEYDCKYCSMTFANRKDLRKHKSLMHGKSDMNQEYVCDICNESFRSREILKNHRDVAYKGKVHLCQLCGKIFNRISNLHQHAKHCRELNIVREFRCNLCPAKFKRQLVLIEHKEKVHGVIEPRVSVYCDKCGKRFGSEKSMGLHQRLYCRERNKT